MVEHQQSFPHSKEQWLTEGTRLFALKQYDKALAIYEQASQLDSTDALIHEYKGNALSGLKRHEEALAACEQAIQLDPTYARAYVYKARVLFRLRCYKEALEAVKQAYRQANQFGTLTDVNF